MPHHPPHPGGGRPRELARRQSRRHRSDRKYGPVNGRRQQATRRGRGPFGRVGRSHEQAGRGGLQTGDHPSRTHSFARCIDLRHQLSGPYERLPRSFWGQTRTFYHLGRPNPDHVK